MTTFAVAKNTNYKEARNLLHDFETNYSRTLVQLDDRFKVSAADESVQIQIRNVPVLDNSRSTFRTAVVFDDDETSVNLESIRVNASLGRTKTRVGRDVGHRLWTLIYFSVINRIAFFNDWKKLSHFDVGYNVRKGRPVTVNTVTASFNTITGQMIEMSQRKK